MRHLITPSAMRDMERRYFDETGTPSIELMERASMALCACLTRRFGSGKRVYFACGPGGNGGDGYACARLYAEAGGRCALFSAAEPATPDAAENRRRALALGIPERTLSEALDAPDVWVDALYGTGLSRAPAGASADLIRRMNADRARGSAVLAVDIPSGLNGLTGSACDPCVRADATCTFQFAKVGHALADGLDVCGELEVADIGIPAAFHPEAPDPSLRPDACSSVPAEPGVLDPLAGLIDPPDALDALPDRPRNLHKGRCGHLLIVAGSMGMAGAAALCAGAALRSGAGLVTVACPASVLPILQALVPCAMGIPLPERDGALAPASAEVIANALRGKSAAVCGCGLSLRAAPEAVEAVLQSGVPALLDADALNLIAQSPALRALLHPHHLITPHPGEAARLLGRPVTNPVADAFALRELNVQALLKGTASVVPVGRHALISASGGCGMAKGGSGDVLSGLTGGLMAQYAASGAAMTGDALALCAAVASELHGIAGEIAQARLGPRGMCASDIVSALPEALRGAR